MTSKLQILAEAAAFYWDIPLEQLKGKSRKHKYTWPRMVCQSIAATKYSQTVIGRFWNIDRSGVSYSNKIVKSRTQTEPDIKNEVDEFYKYLAYILEEAK
jgi:chromosomal replication initiation ATPase DnaA